MKEWVLQTQTMPGGDGHTQKSSPEGWALPRGSRSERKNWGAPDPTSADIFSHFPLPPGPAQSQHFAGVQHRDRTGTQEPTEQIGIQGGFQAFGNSLCFHYYPKAAFPMGKEKGSSKLVCSGQY